MIVSNVVLISGLLLICLAATGLVRVYRERRGLSVTNDPFKPESRADWMRYIRRVRITALTIGILIVASQVWHQYYHYVNGNGP